MTKIISLCKRRGFVFQSSEIYGGLANVWDYGPLGVELKNNIKTAWWRYFVQNRNDMVGLDGSILMNPKIWEASGHIKQFKDRLVECKKCHKRFRPDKLKDASKCPECAGELTKEKLFSGMFKTVIGPVQEQGLTAYLRPETAQAIFVNYKNILDSTNVKIPFGVGQMGKAFRNEITTGNFIFRTLEFEMMEIEYFISPKADWRKLFEQWLAYMYGFMDIIGLDKKKMHKNEISEKERAHYSQRTIDLEYEFPFGREELWAIAYRTDYDLSSHQKMSGKNLEYFDDNTNERYIPHIIEPTFGMDRTMLAVLCDGYTEEKDRIVLKLKPELASCKAAVFPLLANKPKLVKKAREVFDMLKTIFPTCWDDRGNIGKRYYSQDEVGTPFCVTVDFQTLKDDTVTVRNRDTMIQKRVKINDLISFIKEKLNE